MATYIQLLKVLHEGRERLVQEPDFVLQAQQQIHVSGVTLLGIYAVLGDYDFVNILDAPDNEAAAGYSVHLGHAAGVDVTNLHAISLAKFADDAEHDLDELITGASESLPTDSDDD